MTYIMTEKNVNLYRHTEINERLASYIIKKHGPS